MSDIFKLFCKIIPFLFNKSFFPKWIFILLDFLYNQDSLRFVRILFFSNFMQNYMNSDFRKPHSCYKSTSFLFKNVHNTIFLKSADQSNKNSCNFKLFHFWFERPESVFYSLNKQNVLP